MVHVSPKNFASEDVLGHSGLEITPLYFVLPHALHFSIIMTILPLLYVYVFYIKN